MVSIGKAHQKLLARERVDEWEFRVQCGLHVTEEVLDRVPAEIRWVTGEASEKCHFIL